VAQDEVLQVRASSYGHGSSKIVSLKIAHASVIKDCLVKQVLLRRLIEVASNLQTRMAISVEPSQKNSSVSNACLAQSIAQRCESQPQI
jgi:hypothetical protein